jgi:hypothetical protein
VDPCDVRRHAPYQIARKEGLEVVSHPAKRLPGRGRGLGVAEGKQKSRPKAAPANDRFGGADEDRTHDLLNAIQALSQAELRPHRFGRWTNETGRAKFHRGGAHYNRPASPLSIPYGLRVCGLDTFGLGRGIVFGSVSLGRPNFSELTGGMTRGLPLFGGFGIGSLCHGRSSAAAVLASPRWTARNRCTPRFAA